LPLPDFVIFHGQGVFLFTSHFSHFSPLFSEAFALGDVLPPPHSPMLRFGDAVSPIAKAKKTTGLPLSCSKKHPLPVNGYYTLSVFVSCEGSYG
jgi:hypothetical protein